MGHLLDRRNTEIKDTVRNAKDNPFIPLVCCTYIKFCTVLFIDLEYFSNYMNF